MPQCFFVTMATLALVRFASSQDAECLDCPHGQQPVDGGSSCGVCPDGTISHGGTAPCASCHAGRVPNNERSDCQACPPGRAASGATCETCPAGRYSSSSTHGACHECQAGRVPSAEQEYCVRCVAGEQPAADASACERCPAGWVSATNQAECHACGVGTTNNTEQSECVLCPPGSEAEGTMSNASWLGTGVCVGCPRGKYSTLEESCDVCPRGHVPSAEQSYCKRCVAGEEPNNVSVAGGYISDACEGCPAGRVSGTWEAECHGCPAGQVPNQEQGLCVLCPPGKESFGGSGDCRDCELGHYSTLLGSCHPCPAGQVPHTCAANDTECEGQGGSCDTCPEGKAPNEKDENGYEHYNCTLCEAGKQAKPGAAACSACAAGHHSTDGVLCKACLPPDVYNGMEPTQDQTGCVCREGHFNASLYAGLFPASNVSCVPCSPALLGPIADEVVCPGGHDSRLFPKRGFWLGAAQWQVGSDDAFIELDLDDVTALAGEVLGEKLWTDIGFPERDSCTKDTLSSRCRTAETGGDGESDGTCLCRISDFAYYCPSREICPGFTLSSKRKWRSNTSRVLGNMPFGCKENHAGALCGTCTGPFETRKMTGQVCARCESSQWWFVALLLVGYAIFTLFLDFKARQIHVHEDGAALGILTFFFQSLALFADKEGDNAFYGLARLANMEVLLNSEASDGTEICRLRVQPIFTWYMSVILTPCYLMLCAAAVFQIQGYVQARRAEEPVDGTDTLVPEGKIREFCSTQKQKLKDKYSSATALRFLRLRVLERADNQAVVSAHDSAIDFDESANGCSETVALRKWWEVCCEALKRKMLKKQRFRMLLEVMMFIYMGVAKNASKMIPWLTACRYIAVDTADSGHLCTGDSSDCICEGGACFAHVSTLDTTIGCSETYLHQVVATLILIGFVGGFPFWIIRRLRLEETSEAGQDAPSIGEDKQGRFTTMVRVAHIFTPENRQWMAYLLLRRVALVACFQLGSFWGGAIPLWGSDGKMVK